MPNSMKTQVKHIALSLGAVTEMGYLYAGADKGIEAEMQGKDNGDTIYYKVTQLGDPDCVELGADGTGTAATAKDIAQVTIPVKMNDSKLMIGINAFERQVTTIGENKTNARIGQKLGKKAVGMIIEKDAAIVGNVFVASQANAFETFQKAGAFIKGHVEGTIYGFMDWQIWGDLTGKGQQAVPCGLAESRFGKGLQGSWTLIDQLRVISDIKTIEAPATITTGAKASIVNGKVQVNGTIKAGDMFTIAGVYAKDVNDMPTQKLFVFRAAEDITTSALTDVTAKLSNAQYGVEDTATGWIAPAAVTNAAVTSVLEAGKRYAACLIRTEGAQAFGVMKECSCEGAKYEKSSLDGVTIHVNAGEDIGAFKTDKRFDMIFASKLVEPRAAALVLYPLS